MPIAIQCSGCGKTYRLKDELAGKRVKCGCGHAMQVPDAVQSSDPMEALLNESLPAPDVSLPAGARPSATAVGGLSGEAASTTAKKKKRKKKSTEPDELTLMTRVLMGAGILGGLVLVVAIVAFVVMYVRRPGYPTPEETFAAHQEALYQGDWKSLIRTYSPESQEKLVGSMLMLASMPMFESSTFVNGTLNKYGVDGMLEVKDDTAGGSDKPSDSVPEGGAAADGEETLSEEEKIEAMTRNWQALAREAEERRAKAVAAIDDKVMFYVDFMAALEAEQEKQLPRNPVLKLNAQKAVRDARRTLASGTLGTVKVEGDRAESEVTFIFPGDEDGIVVPVAFKKNGGRWFVHLPSDEDLESSPMQSSLIGSDRFDFIGLPF